MLCVALSFTSCITYQKCVDKYGQYPKDTIFVPVKIPVPVIVKVPADSTHTSFNPNTLKRDSVYEFKDSVNKMTIQYWYEKYSNLLNVKAKYPGKTLHDTVYLDDTIPCPPQAILIKPISTGEKILEAYKGFAAWFVGIGALILLIWLLIRKK